MFGLFCYRNKNLLGAPASRLLGARPLLGAPGLTSRSKDLLGTRSWTGQDVWSLLPLELAIDTLWSAGAFGAAAGVKSGACDVCVKKLSSYACRVES